MGKFRADIKNANGKKAKTKQNGERETRGKNENAYERTREAYSLLVREIWFNFQDVLFIRPGGGNYNAKERR